MSGFNPAVWLDVYEYCYETASRAFPCDQDAAEEIASDCFDRYMRIYADVGLENYKAWVGRSIAGLRKNYLKQQWRYRWIEDETDDPLERIRPVQPDQETLVDIKRWKERIDQLEDRYRDAFLVIADGGNLKDVMEELGIGPREALIVITEARRQLLSADAAPSSNGRTSPFEGENLGSNPSGASKAA